ncbi:MULTISPECIES: hypothetical protein [Enterococcus]|uniref:Uncharacterized protein n=1 Tax=Enterococcus alcedinis TaxID=1274384 RepID=A0A917N652_9ENTE|nr:hypothetical protein [Enterococcus alcedinis]MBP2101875.1 hypothetical protein [Enterococcus alcedinis]GGI65437.1 hypothetical protein GCM10011482_10910 [Enterococcus alcedinis]
MFILSFVSLGIGLILPVIALFQRQKEAIYSNLSLIACAFGIWLQYYAVKAMVLEEDLNALFDTVPTMQAVLGSVLLITVLLNAFLWWRTKKVNK